MEIKWTLLLLSFLLVGCGGGGSDGPEVVQTDQIVSTPVEDVPNDTIVAGPLVSIEYSTTANQGDTIIFRGVVTNNFEATEYQWSLAKFPEGSTPEVQFVGSIARIVNAEPGDYTVVLIIKSGFIVSDPVTVTTTVLHNAPEAQKPVDDQPSESVQQPVSDPQPVTSQQPTAIDSPVNEQESTGEPVTITSVSINFDPEPEPEPEPATQPEPEPSPSNTIPVLASERFDGMAAYILDFEVNDLGLLEVNAVFENGTLRRQNAQCRLQIFSGFDELGSTFVSVDDLGSGERVPDKSVFFAEGLTPDSFDALRLSGCFTSDSNLEIGFNPEPDFEYLARASFEGVDIFVIGFTYSQFGRFEVQGLVINHGSQTVDAQCRVALISGNYVVETSFVSADDVRPGETVPDTSGFFDDSLSQESFDRVRLSSCLTI